MPKLCPGSCTRTTQLLLPLYQVSRAGLCGLPTEPRPPQVHGDPPLRVWPMYQR